MQIIKIFLSRLILVALVVGLAGPAWAIQTQSRMSQGNNVQLDFTDNGAGVLAGGTSMFPKGSGNLIPVYEGGWGHSMAVARDKNGDGAIEDTLYGTGRGRSIGYMNGSLESYAELEALLTPDFVEPAASADRLEHNRVWSSLDPDDMADWPAEFREGRTSSGAPILHGAETIVVRLSDAFSRSFAASNVPRGVSFEYRFHFLNFGESNDMAYGHLFIRNMSEYLKWNPNEGFRGQVASTPNGQKWNFALCYYTNYFGIGSDAVSMDEGYTYHPAKEIVCVTDRDGLDGGFTNGGVTFSVGHKILRMPSFKGQTMVMTGFHGMRWGADFGGPTTQDLYQMGSAGLVYRASLGELYPNLDELCQQMYKGALNPVTGRPAWGIPGLPRPTDQYYNVWLWGRQGRTQYNTFAEIKDFGPRDSTSCDFALMFVYPAGMKPLVFKANAVANIYDPDLQTAMVPMEHYAEVAQLVYEGGYILPETPVPPSLTIVPGERQATITWSNVNINTPDAYYAFIQQHPEIDPNGVYRQYDFEGYRLYRNFVSPSNAHSEMIFECSLSAGNVQFFYIDHSDKDQPYYRLRNGLKVWYSLVPYDKNYDPSTGAELSLPALESGKTWNRPREGMYTVMPHSNASNFKDATLGGVTYTPGASAALTEGTSVELRGDGTGKLLDPPKHLEPVVDIRLETVTSEKITTAQSYSMVCSDMQFFDFGGCNWPTGTREMQLKDSGGKVLSKQMITGVHGGGTKAMSILLQGPIDANGLAFGVWGDFSGISPGSLTYGFDTGGYTGADVDAARYRCAMVVESAPNNMGWVRSSQFTITWKSAAGGGLTIEVTNNTMNQTISFGQFPDDFGWGLTPGGTIGDRWGDANNLYNELELPKSERTTKMLQSLPADNTDDFGIWLNGIFWLFANVSAMPEPGTVMTMYTCWGSWNDDQTVFTQAADIPYPGDTWKIDINPMSLDKKDADLGKIKVVPNPYMASSVLDLSPLSRRIEFVNLPDRCTIRIFTLSGNLVNVLNHAGANRFGWGNFTDVDRIKPDNSAEVFTGYDNHSGTEPWNLRNRFGQTVASGLYFYHVTDSRGKTQTGRFYIIN